MINGIILLVLFAVGGLWLSGSLFVHRRILTWLAGGLGLAWGVFLASVAVVRALSLGAEPKQYLFYGVALTLFVIGFLLRRTFAWPTTNGWRDLWVMLVLVPVFCSICLISSANGEMADHSWNLRSFYNGDVTTFVSLVQKSLLTNGWVTENPFAAGVTLEYPTLLHSGVAEIVMMLGGGLAWMYFLPTMSFLVALITVPLFFLYMDVVQAEPASPYEKWFGVLRRSWVYAAQAGVIAYILGIAWDNYVYPQSHFFLMGLFMLFIALLVAAGRNRGKLFGLQFALAAILAITLLLANAVTGAISVALLIFYAAIRVFDEKRTPKARVGYAIAVIAAGLIFVLLSSGNAQFGFPHFSYGAAGDMMRFAPLFGFLIAALLLGTVDSFLSLSVAMLFALGLFTFFFAGRGIIVDNASRFFYHAGLVGFPLLLPLCIRVWFWARREIFYTSRPGITKLMPIFLIVTGAVIVLLPPLTSIASTVDHLAFDAPSVISPAMREATWWIADHTGSSDVIVASPTPPWAIPFFTGRSNVRSGEADGSPYWLSRTDELWQLHLEAFAGEKDAQEAIVSHADYLVLTAEERPLWEPLSFEKVFDISDAAIYRLR